ncbi:hypothetical protein [Natrinema gari]|uniref:Uncharacterized protein n=1 Tax=Natrinema gari JCM 14663 TaxID=1230459 RepID=L9YQQ9_9EURY|nr:hypothetical protein [Natrinema gari]ELY75268.1 hypothetical protein C486_20594 [Natrinema gari JCM 14663]
MTPPICSATGSIEDGIEEGKELGEIRTDVSAAIRNALGSVSGITGRDSIESVARSVTDGSSAEGLLDSIGGDGRDEPAEDESELHVRPQWVLERGS